mmetsp:Transcript_12496/g.23446  ORF Transcript_12496/g.23446 Transcript_12496/m.23446 type:complete len:412 (-) Transcript_12496:1806-3041(-)
MNHDESSAPEIQLASITSTMPGNHDEDTPITKPAQIGFFAKYLTIWIALSMLVGTTVGALLPSVPTALEKATISSVWIPGAVFVWLMVYPMMLGVRWDAIRQIHRSPGGLILTSIVNWAIQPFLMWGLASLFFGVIYQNILSTEQQKEYIAGSTILGGSPCTAMVFVWSSLANGDPNYTLVQVVLNDLILLLLYVPTTKLLLNISNIALPWGTVFLSVALFVVAPLAMGVITQVLILRREDGQTLLNKVRDKLQPVSSISLVSLVIFIFMSQAKTIVANPTHVLLAIVPLFLQTMIVFFLTYGLAYYYRLEHNIAGPAAFIGSSNFFELAVALAITVYGPKSGAVMVTVVGVLVEVPLMLMEVAIVNATKERYETQIANCKVRWNHLSSDKNVAASPVKSEIHQNIQDEEV